MENRIVNGSWNRLFVWRRFQCDGCRSFIVGTRFHCLECDDFDLCIGCHTFSKFPPQWVFPSLLPAPVPSFRFLSPYLSSNRTAWRAIIGYNQMMGSFIFFVSPTAIRRPTKQQSMPLDQVCSDCSSVQSSRFVGVLLLCAKFKWSPLIDGCRARQKSKS